jgi:flagellar basal-body rod protein FlgF
LDSGFYAACQGMRTQSQVLELIANNLANVNTTGYLAGQSSFYSIFASSRGTLRDPLNQALNDFDSADQTTLDLTSGNLQRTGNPFDLAIQGEGFFAVKTKAGTRYTRNGNFHVSPTGELTTAAGDLVLGAKGPVMVPAGQVSISGDGTVSVDGAAAGKLRIVAFVPGTQIEAEGDSLYSAPAKTAVPALDSSVRQGMLEASNVNAIASVVNLLTVERNHEMLQRALSAFYSEFDQVAANDLPKV